MNETKKTIWFVGAAVFLALVALVLAPGRITPSAFLDQGEPFFPEFSDPNAATTLEVFDYDEATGEPRPFKVTFNGGRWTIPSHHDYPADAKDRLAKTAAGVIGIKKDDFRSDNVGDHELCGVVDPLDEAALGLSGRGQRITLKGSGGNILADFIVGHEVENRPGFRFVRVPEQKRVYAVRMDIDPSTNFEDWIETDLLEVDKAKIEQVILMDYSINERTHRIDQRENLALMLQGLIWTANNMKSTQEIDSTNMQQLLTAIDSLSIVGVRPKPEGLSKDLKESKEGSKISTNSRMSLQSKGFYFTREGDLKSNEGELQVRTTDGVVYTIRFGEVLFGSGLAVSAGAEGDQEQTGAAENRYLFITTTFDAAQFPEPPEATYLDFLNKLDSLLTDEDREQKRVFDEHERWQSKVDRGREISDRLNTRFADWYYVISSESFDKLNLSRQDLVVKKEESSS
jgi:hypothetical protein